MSSDSDKLISSETLDSSTSGGSGVSSSGGGRAGRWGAGNDEVRPEEKKAKEMGVWTHGSNAGAGVLKGGKSKGGSGAKGGKARK